MTHIVWKPRFICRGFITNQGFVGGAKRISKPSTVPHLEALNRDGFLVCQRYVQVLPECLCGWTEFHSFVHPQYVWNRVFFSAPRVGTWLKIRPGLAARTATTWPASSPGLKFFCWGSGPGGSLKRYPVLQIPAFLGVW